MVDENKEVNLIERQNELLKARRKEEDDKIIIDNLNKLDDQEQEQKNEVEFNK